MSTIKSSLVNFYNNFHHKTAISSKIITEKNFTYENILNKIQTELSIIKNKKILDYGCGSGSISFYLASRGGIVTGYDISTKAIQICNQSRKVNNVPNIKFTNNLSEISDKYDYIFSIEVLEHVEDDYKLCTYLYNKLKNKGKLILTTPSLNAPLYKLKLLTTFDKKVGHLRRYSEKSLLEVLKKSKFSMIKIYKEEGIFRNSLYTLPLLGNLIKLFRWPLSTFINKIDHKLIPLFGESDLVAIASKS